MINAILLDHEEGIVSRQLIFNCRLEIFLCSIPGKGLRHQKLASI
jgi:hypothetical protein